MENEPESEAWTAPEVPTSSKPVWGDHLESLKRHKGLARKAAATAEQATRILDEFYGNSLPLGKSAEAETLFAQTASMLQKGREILEKANHDYQEKLIECKPSHVYIYDEVFELTVEAAKKGALSRCTKLDIIPIKLSLLDVQVQAEDIVLLLGAAKWTLCHLRMEIDNVHGDFDMIIQSLLECKQLRSFCCERNNIFHRSIDDPENLGVALGQMPSLQTISFEHSARSDHEIAGVFKMLARAARGPNQSLRSIRWKDKKRLDTLFLSYVRLSEFEFLLTSISQCNRIQELLFDVNFHEMELTLLSNFLPVMTSLKIMKLGTHQWRVEPLAAALRFNESLETLEICSQERNPLSDHLKPELEAFCASLKENYTLKKLQRDHYIAFMDNDETPRDDEPELMPGLMDLRSKIKFYLALNQAGRAKLLRPPENRQPSDQDWLNAISSQKDPSVIFFFLGKNPSLFFNRGLNPRGVVRGGVSTTTDSACDPLPVSKKARTG